GGVTPAGCRAPAVTDGAPAATDPGATRYRFAAGGRCCHSGRDARRTWPMLAVLLALAAAAGYGGADFAAGLAARRASVVRVAVLAEVGSAALLLCVVPVVSRQAPSPAALVLAG